MSGLQEHNTFLIHILPLFNTYLIALHVSPTVLKINILEAYHWLL